MGELAEIIPFRYERMKLDVRTVLIDGEPWFVAKDVCKVLELADVSKAVGRLDEDEKGTNSILTPGGVQEMLCVSESGLYSLVLGSRKEEAREFKRWVTHEVLPSIRKTGAYHIEERQLPTNFLEALKALVAVEEERLQLAAQVEEMQPKADGYDLLLSANNAQTMMAVAKAFKTGRNKLFAFLRDQKILMSNNLPYQEFLDRGYFIVREVSTLRGAFGVKNVPQTLVTARGLEFIRTRLEKPNSIARVSFDGKISS